MSGVITVLCTSMDLGGTEAVLHKCRTKVFTTTRYQLDFLEGIVLFPTLRRYEDQTRRSVEDEVHRLSTSSLECVMGTKQYKVS